jgi:hypothetical protein
VTVYSDRAGESAIKLARGCQAASGQGSEPHNLLALA